jgi:outer membrane phospholipase A
MLRCASRATGAAARIVVCFIFYLQSSLCAFAFDSGKRVDKRDTEQPPLIEGYEPNVLGYAWQDEDESFVDISLSLKYRLFRNHVIQWTCPLHNGCEDRWRAYLTFSSRLGFYWETRDSDPVIARNFTPKLLLRYTPDAARDSTGFLAPGKYRVYEDWSYIDVAYAHESNGQIIDSDGAYVLEQRLNRRQPELALDKVSRGWDYVQLAGKYSLFKSQPTHRLAAYGDLRYFLRHGLIQGVPEEYHAFENDREAKRRGAVEGVMAAAEYQWRQKPLIGSDSAAVLTDPRFMLRYETGYEPLFEHSTFRVEIGATLLELPISLWYQNGYGSSIARYYKKLSAFGIQLRLAEF